MSEATLTPVADETTTDETTVSEPGAKYAEERQRHGDESLCQLFGSLAADAVLVEKDGRYPAVSGRIGVSRGAGQASSFINFWVRPVKDIGSDEDSTRPTTEEMQTLADSLKRGQRVRLYGKIEARPLGRSYDEENDKDVPSPRYLELIERLGLTEEQAKDDDVAKSYYFSNDTSITLWMHRDELDVDGNFNAKNFGPITLLPPIGDGNGTGRNPF